MPLAGPSLLATEVTDIPNDNQVRLANKNSTKESKYSHFAMNVRLK